MNIKKGVLNPRLIPPAQIITYLTSALAHIPQGLNFPIGIKLENMHVLYEILTLSAFSDTKSITVILDIPLLNTKKFKLSKVHPVPTKINKSFYAYIEPLDSYVVLDTSVQDYIQMSKQDLSKCKTINQRWAAVGPLTRQLPLPICLSHSVPSVVKETARRYEGCHDELAVLASSRLASRGIPDNADESGRTPSLRVSDFAQRCYKRSIPLYL